MCEGIQGQKKEMRDNMAKDIKKFIEEVADYINRFVAGRSGGHIIECSADGLLMNRGHAIPIKCSCEEEDIPLCGPCFYAEELMARFPGHSASFVAEVIAAETEKEYPAMIETARRQKQISATDINDIDPEDLFITATNTIHDVHGLSKAGYPVREHEELGLISMLKMRIPHPADGHGSMLVPVHNTDIDDGLWERATHNSLLQCAFKVCAAGVEEDDMPVCGEMEDTNRFYDYFYMLAADAWAPVVELTEADRIYIFPYAPHKAGFCIDNDRVNSDSKLYDLRTTFMEDAVKHMPHATVYVLDCSTMEITKFATGKWGEK